MWKHTQFLKIRNIFVLIFTVTDWGYYRAEWRYEFCVEKQYLITILQMITVSKILFLTQENKICNFMLSCNVLFIIKTRVQITCKNNCVLEIMSLMSSLERIAKIRHSGPGAVSWVLRLIYVYVLLFRCEHRGIQRWKRLDLSDWVIRSTYKSEILLLLSQGRYFGKFTVLWFWLYNRPYKHLPLWLDVEDWLL